MVVIKIGDLLKFTEDAIGHGCNCQNTMGSGVAKVIRDAYPEVYKADTLDGRTPQGKLGGFSKAHLSNGKVCYNIYSQYDFKGRYKGKIDLDYDALEAGLKLVKKDMLDNGMKSIALPRIGAGLAGGNWDTIFAIITSIFNDDSIQVVIYVV